MPSLACGPFLLALLLAACGDRTAPTAEESRSLDNAGEMLNAAPDALSNIDASEIDAKPANSAENAAENDQ